MFMNLVGYTIRSGTWDALRPMHGDGDNSKCAEGLFDELDMVARFLIVRPNFRNPDSGTRR